MDGEESTRRGKMQTRSTQTKSTRCAGIDSPAPDESRSLSCGLSPVSTLIVLALVWGSFPAGQLWAQSRGNAKPAGDSAALEGKQSFESICAACHGLDGRGGERGPDIARRREIQRLPDSAVLRTVRQGVPGKGMPAFASLTALQVQAVVRHLRILQGLGAAAKMPGDPERGKATLFGQFVSSQCHMGRGEGGFICPGLSSYASGHPPAETHPAITLTKRNLDHCKRTVVVVTQDGHT